MCSVRNAVPFLVCNLDTFVLTVGLCFVLFVFEHVMFSNWRIHGKTRDYLLHRALRRQIFQQQWKVMSCNISVSALIDL